MLRSEPRQQEQNSRWVFDWQGYRVVLDLDEAGRPIIVTLHPVKEPRHPKAAGR